MDKAKLDELLDKPAFEAVASIKGPTLGDQVQDDLKTEVKETETTEDADTEETETGGKKVRIPASRLKTLTSELRELREQIHSTQSYQERIAELESRINNNQQKDELPSEWTALYGDDENSRKAYQFQQKIAQDNIRVALEQMDRERTEQETARAELEHSIEQSFDDQMDTLEESIGRELTASQKEELLDIIAEGSPMENGKYVGYMSVEQAYNFWQRNSTDNSGKKEMAKIAGIQSSGSTGAATTSTTPPQWGDWRKRFGG